MRSSITLTFDNGPTADVTPEVLDCLAKHRIQSTFFVIGTKAETADGRALIQRARAEGHWIGNHTYSHSTPLGELDAASAVREIELAEQALSSLDRPRKLFRPYGRAGRIGRHLLHPAAVEKLQADKFTCVLWNSVPGDWRDPDGWIERALEQIRSNDWNLLVLHDIAGGAMRQLDRFLGCLRDQDFDVRQDFPPKCTPIVDGRIVEPIEKYVAEIPRTV